MKATKAIIVVLALVLPGWLGSCLGPRPPEPTPRPRPTLPVMTRVPAPVPYPTLGPDENVDGVVVDRSLAVPPAPTLLGWPKTFVITVSDDGIRWDGDVLLRWRHPAPPGVDYYEVWHGLWQPYSTPENEGTTTALRFLSDAPGQDFVYQSGAPGFDYHGGLDSWAVTACNRAGCSAKSNEVGVVTYSLKQGIEHLPQLGQ